MEKENPNKRRFYKAIDHSFKSSLFMMVFVLLQALFYFVFDFSGFLEGKNIISSIFFPSVVLFLIFYSLFFLVSEYISIKSGDKKSSMIIFIPLTPFLLYRKIRENIRKL